MAAAAWSRAAIRSEVRRRADHQLAQRRLTVDYYRIRRRLSYPLPVREFVLPALPLRRESPANAYPWATWLTWAMEERIHCLGWAAEWFRDRAAAAACEADLAALAGWPAWRQYDKPDLSLGHCARMLHAASRWRWPSPRLRQRIDAAFARMLADGVPSSDRYFAAWTNKEAVLAGDLTKALHNIPIIGTVGLALAARAVGHPAREALDARLEMLHGALLDAFVGGFCEGYCYDGYTLDFLALWLQGLPAARRRPIVGHPRFRQPFEESCFLAAPGDALAAAEIGDVEPRQMLDHAMAHARCRELVDDPRVDWWLGRCDPARLRCDTLAEIARNPLRPRARPPKAGALDARYAVVLRSGWEARDVAAAMSCATSPMGHLQHDDGTVLVGSDGRWLISDAGYQQYLPTSERDFSLGPAAHNCPLIDGAQQTAKACRRVALEAKGRTLRAELDLTACYAKELGLARVTRGLWLVGRELLVVGDLVEGAKRSVRWSWHGHPEAAWWWEDGAAQLALGDVVLRVRTPGRALDATMVDRLRGSRGQLTLGVDLDPAAGVHWWVFSFAARPEPIAADGARLRVGAHRFALD